MPNVRNAVAAVGPDLVIIAMGGNGKFGVARRRLANQQSGAICLAKAAGSVTGQRDKIHLALRHL